MREECLDLFLGIKNADVEDPNYEPEFWNAWKQLVAQLSDDESRELDTAIHEAGHAVMRWLVGLTFTEVTIVPNPDLDLLGSVRGEPFPDHLRRDISSYPCKATEMYMDREMICALAGYAAESLHLEPNEPDSEQSRRDYKWADDLAEYRFGNPNKDTEYVDEMVRHARESLFRFYLHVAVLAIELLDKQTVVYDDAISLLKRVPVGWKT